MQLDGERGAMNKNLAVVLSSLLIFFVMASLVQAQQRDTRSAEEKEFEFRDSLFRVIRHKATQLPTAKANGDQAAFKKAAADIAYLAGMITEGFQIENNVLENSLALPAIWEDFDDFTERAATLKNAAQALADSGDMDSYDQRGFGGENCGGCHRNYKKRVN